MDYGSFIAPVTSLPPFEEYVEPYCSEMTKKLEDLQRKMQVQLRKQGIQARSEARAVWPGFNTEYKKLLVDTKVADAEAGDIAPLIGYESETETNALSTSTDNDNNNQDLFPRFRTAVSSLEEEVLWKINFSQGNKVKDTKIFFFGSVLFRLSFGHHAASSQYYLHLSVAENVSSDIRVYCKYRIHDPTTEQVLMTQVAESNYIDNFAGPELVNYLDSFKRLLISVVLSSEVGPNGELLGVQLDHGLDISPYV